MDIIAQLGELALGSRLKRVSEQMMQDGVGIYETYGIKFNPYWFPVFYAIAEQGKLTIMELAQITNNTHPAVIKISKALEKQGLIDSFRDNKDKRKRWLKLSEEGLKLLPTLQLVWKDIAAGINEALHEQNNHILQSLSKLESSLNNKSLFQRVKEKRTQRLLDSVRIVEFSPELAPHFARINYNWIEQYFKIEEADRMVLDNPKEQIIDKGGYICFAEVDGIIAGTCALKKYSEELYELVKMGVDTKYQGLQLGKKLGQRAIEKARELGCKTLFLESNKSLTPALNLYQKLGFRQVPMVSSISEYERADIKMEIEL
jgi:DNA-binding MarR family transcriptional regulator/GNAT superfamily N-acetyltransferase